MSTAIQGFGQQLPPATNYSQSLSFDGQEPPGGPKPPPDTLQSAFNDSRIAAATFTPSEAASVLLSTLPAAPPAQDVSKPSAPLASESATPPAGTPLQSQAATTQAQNPQLSVVAQQKSEAANPVKQFEKSQEPPPFTLSNALPDPNKINQKSLYARTPTPFQVRQFSDLLKTLRSITSAVLPNFSYSA